MAKKNSEKSKAEEVKIAHEENESQPLHAETFVEKVMHAVGLDHHSKPELKVEESKEISGSPLGKIRGKDLKHYVIKN